MTNVTYRYAQIFNYDSMTNQIIETRSIKRDIKDETDSVDIQILKARTKVHDVLDLPKSLNEEVQKGGMISFNMDVTKEDVALYMQRSFDLFNLNLDLETNNKLKTVIQDDTYETYMVS